VISHSPLLLSAAAAVVVVVVCRPRIQQLVANAGAVLLQREIPEAINVPVAAAATAAGVPVMLDAGGIAEPIAPELLQHITWCSPNETELARLTGLPTETKDQVQAAAQGLMRQGVDQVLVKLGAEGSMLVGCSATHGSATAAGQATVQGTAPIIQKAVPVEKVVDTTGAGDCFTAAFVVGILQGKEPHDALRFASAAASICVQRPGAMPSMPDSREVESVLQGQ
jgi:ribokinase